MVGIIVTALILLTFRSSFGSSPLLEIFGKVFKVVKLVSEKLIHVDSDVMLPFLFL